MFLAPGGSHCDALQLRKDTFGHVWKQPGGLNPVNGYAKLTEDILRKLCSLDQSQAAQLAPLSEITQSRAGCGQKGGTTIMNKR